MATLQELLAQRAELERQIVETQRAERAEAVAKVRSLMSEYGLTLADLSSKAAAGPKASSSRKVAVKYRDAASGDTWTGRGLQPKWLKAALASGKTLADFEV